MRHRVAGKRLGRSKDHRKLLRRNLINELFRHGEIKTTRAKAESVRGAAEKLITIAKRGLAAEAEDPARGVHARRIARSRMNDHDLVQKLFDEIAPLYAERPGGYTRMFKLGLRKGDAAEMVLLALVDYEKEA